MRAPAKMKWRADPNFATFKVGARELVIHRDIAPQAARIMQKLGELASASEAGAGNRQSAFRLMLDDGVELFARRGRRGGMIASILSDVYLGMSPRPLTELTVTIEARRRGIPVAEPMGAMVEWIGPALYRGFFLTRAVRGMTLWEFVKTDDDPTVREHVLEQARAAIDTMHDKGLFHADLNLHNLLVTQVRESFTVVILDLDKARLVDAPLSPAMRRTNAARLLRSARKLDPAGKFLDAAAISILNLE
jgi:3-deoxy-D-manno-octulosonic acid kinase